MAEEKKKSVPKKKSPAKKAAPKAAVKKATVYVPKLKRDYKELVAPSLMKRFDYKNVMEVPKLVSVSLNMGIGDAKTNSKHLESAVNELTLISGQKPVTTKSKKDISNFKIRRGYPVGCKVTLRSTKMFEFLERLIAVALPRSRDFRGLSWKSFDGRGNYNFGVKEQIIFTEIDYDKIQEINGLNVTVLQQQKQMMKHTGCSKSLGSHCEKNQLKKILKRLLNG